MSASPTSPASPPSGPSSRISGPVSARPAGARPAQARGSAAVPTRSQPGNSSPAGPDHGQVLQLDLSGIQSKRLTQEVRDAVLAQYSHSVRERDGVWGGPAAWIHTGTEPADSPALLFAHLSRVAEAVTPVTSMRWLTASRSRPLWVVAFVEGRPDGQHATRIEGVLRSLDGRLSLIPEPRFTPLRRRWAGGEEQVRGVLDLLRPDAILEVRTLPAPIRLLVRFGDGRAATLTPEQLGVAGASDELQFLAASPGPGGRTLRIPARSGPEGEGLELDAEAVQALVQEVGTVEALVPDQAGVSVPIGFRIRAARREQGLSQAALGARIGVGQAVISNLERGVHTPRMDTLKRVARGLGISLPELLAFRE